MKAAKVQTLPPWKKPDGSKKSVREISRLGKSWDLKTWEEFLDEDIGKLTDDGRLIKKNPDTIADEEPESGRRGESAKLANLDLAEVFGLAFEELPPKQVKVLGNIFYFGLSVAETARKLGVSQTAVHRTKKLALERLATLLRSEKFGKTLDLRLRSKQGPQTNRTQRSKKDSIRRKELKKKHLQFIEENLCRLSPPERRVTECLYLKQMTLKATAIALDRTVGEIKAIMEVAFKRLEKIYSDGYEKNKNQNGGAAA